MMLLAQMMALLQRRFCIQLGRYGSIQMDGMYSLHFRQHIVVVTVLKNKGGK